MSPRPLIVLTLEGLATAGLSCYGSSWNTTPAIDAIAAGGCLWDRWIASDDRPLGVLGQWIQPGPEVDWTARWRNHGSIDLLTDDRRIRDNRIDTKFDRTTWVDPHGCEESGEAAADIEETRLGRLIAAAIKRDASGAWGVLWLHSRFLSECWDAPRGLFPIEAEEMESPSEDVELLPEDGSEFSPPQLESLPLLFDTVRPPEIQLEESCHPDLVTSWMRTYACQVRLIDLLIEVLLQSLSVEDPQVVLAGTSGFSLGQNGWIGHAAGPLRSCDLRLPMLISDRGPIRSPQVTASETFPAILGTLADDSQSLIPPLQWCQNQGEFEPRVITCCQRAAKVVTTSRWTFVRDLDQTDHLFLKPDDVEDANDIGRLRNDIIDKIVAAD